MTPLPHDDLASIVARVGPLWDRLRLKRLMITGATGFIGRWMYTSAIKSDKVIVFPLTHANGDIRDVLLPEVEFIIHLATPTSVTNHVAPVVIRDGTKRICELAQRCGARLLNASSGCVSHPFQRKQYGAFAEAKADAEKMVEDVGGINARVFSVYGPGMRTDRGYAIADFIQQGLAGKTIEVMDGAPVRGFQYVADTVVGLWRLLLDGKPGTYDVGTANLWSIQGAADVIASQMSVDYCSTCLGSLDPYAPPVSFPKDETSFQEGIRKTIAWLKQTA